MADGVSTKRASTADPSTDALADQLYTEQPDGTLLGRPSRKLQQAASQWAALVSQRAGDGRKPVGHRANGGRGPTVDVVAIADARVGVIVDMLGELHARMEQGLRGEPMNAGDHPSAVVAEMATHLRCLVDPTPP